MSAPFPVLDGRRFEKLLEEVRRLAPVFVRMRTGTPDAPGPPLPWTPDFAGDRFARALFEGYAYLAEQITSRIDAAPRQKLIAFLSMLGIEQVPASPARSVVRFDPVPVEPELPPPSLEVPRAARIVAPAAAGGPEVPFETEDALRLIPRSSKATSPNVLQALYAFDPERDVIFAPPPPFLASQPGGPTRFELATFAAAGSDTIQLATAEGIAKDDHLMLGDSNDAELRQVRECKGSIVALTQPLDRSHAAREPVQRLLQFRAFREIDLQERAFLLGHASLFQIDGAGTVELDVEVAAPGPPLAIRWEFGTQDGWSGFALREDSTLGLSRSGRVVLDKIGPPEIAEREIDGVKSRWIRGFLDQKLYPGQEQPALLDSVKISVRSAADGIRADYAFYNTTPLDPGSEFFPFGRQPNRFDSFYIGSDEVFSKREAKVTLRFQLEPWNTIGPLALSQSLGERMIYAVGRLAEVLERDLDQPGAPWRRIGPPRVVGRVRREARPAIAGDRILLPAHDHGLLLRRDGRWERIAPDRTFTACATTSGSIAWAVTDASVVQLDIAEQTTVLAEANLIGASEPTEFARDGGPEAMLAAVVSSDRKVTLISWDADQRVPLIRDTGLTLAPNTGIAIAAAEHDEAGWQVVLVETNGAVTCLGPGWKATAVDRNAPAELSIGPRCGYLDETFAHVLGTDARGRVWELVSRIDRDSVTPAFSLALSPSDFARARGAPLVEHAANIHGAIHRTTVVVSGFGEEILRCERLDATTAKDQMVLFADSILPATSSVLIEGEADLWLFDTRGSAPLNGGSTANRVERKAGPASPRLPAVDGNGSWSAWTVDPRGASEVVNVEGNGRLSVSTGSPIAEGDLVELSPGNLWIEVLSQNASGTFSIRSLENAPPEGAYQAQAYDRTAITLLSRSSAAVVLVDGIRSIAPDRVTAVGIEGEPVALVSARIPSLDALVLETPSDSIQAGAWVRLLEADKEWTSLPRENDQEIAPELAWEYWNGRSWSRLTVEDGTTDLQTNGDVGFGLPNDADKTNVGGQDGHFVRARIVSGDYGREVFYLEKSDDPASLKSSLEGVRPPEVTSLELLYSLEQSVLPERCLALNSLQLLDHTDANQQLGAHYAAFEPFESDDARGPSLYLGFAIGFEGGPHRWYVDAAEQEVAPEQEPDVEWQRWGEDREGDPRGWQALAVRDETHGMTRAGMVGGHVPARMVKRRLFGHELYWLAARILPAGEEVARTELRGIHPNAVPVLQSQTHRDEIVGSSDGSPGQSFPLGVESPVLPGIELRVREALSEQERTDLVRTRGEEAVVEREEFDGSWVIWEAVDFLNAVGPDARCFSLDEAAGTLTFGDDRHGRVPPAGAAGIRAFSFREGGGERGNVAAGAIAGLVSAIAGVEAVSNPIPAAGGSDTASFDEMLVLGPAKLAHRERAVTPEDFERLAVEASREVVRARCQRATDPIGRSAGGWVRVAIVPRSIDPQPRPSAGLRQAVRRRLEDAAALSLRGSEGSSGRIAVVAPRYVRVRVELRVYARSLDQTTAAREAVARALADYLHPVRGGDAGTGWDFGRGPAASDVYGFVLARRDVQAHVHHLDGLRFRVRHDDGSEPPATERVDLDPDQLVSADSPALELGIGEG